MTDVSAGEWSNRFAAVPDRAARIYYELLVPRLFDPWAQVLVDAVGVTADDEVLDLACGPGTVARAAAVCGARVTGCDISPAMLALAREVSPDAITFVETPAAPLDVADESFDVAVCQQGFQFFPDRPAALAELRRALRPGGRVGIAVWGPIEECEVFRVVADAIGDVLGTEDRGRYIGGPWALADPRVVAGLLAEAGFAEVAVSTTGLPMTVEGGAAQLLDTVAVTALAADAEAHGDALLAALRHRVGDGEVSGATTAHVFTARR